VLSIRSKPRGESIAPNMMQEFLNYYSKCLSEEKTKHKYEEKVTTRYAKENWRDS
jgi:hypothetical protein